MPKKQTKQASKPKTKPSIKLVIEKLHKEPQPGR